MPAWNAHIDVWLILGSVVASYLIWCARHERDTGQATSAHDRRLFLSGMAVLFVASVWPLHDLAERTWYMAHMVQHMAYTLVAAPLLVAGIPAWMWRSGALADSGAGADLAQHDAPGDGARDLRRAAAVHALAGRRHGLGGRLEPLHLALHTLIVLSALILWWPVFSPLPEMPPICRPGNPVPVRPVARADDPRLVPDLRA